MKTVKTTQSVHLGLLRIERFIMEEEIHTEYDEEGRSWVVIPDRQWDESDSMDYIQGVPILFPNTVYKRVRE